MLALTTGNREGGGETDIPREHTNSNNVKQRNFFPLSSQLQYFETQWIGLMKRAPKMPSTYRWDKVFFFVKCAYQFQTALILTFTATWLFCFNILCTERNLMRSKDFVPDFESEKKCFYIFISCSSFKFNGKYLNFIRLAQFHWMAEANIQGRKRIWLQNIQCLRSECSFLEERKNWVIISSRNGTHKSTKIISQLLWCMRSIVRQVGVSLLSFAMQWNAK